MGERINPTGRKKLEAIALVTAELGANTVLCTSNVPSARPDGETLNGLFAKAIAG